MIPSAESDSSAVADDDGAALVKEVLEENPPVRERPRRVAPTLVGTAEDVHAKTDEAPVSEPEEPWTCTPRYRLRQLQTRTKTCRSNHSDGGNNIDTTDCGR